MTRRPLILPCIPQQRRGGLLAHDRHVRRGAGPADRGVSATGRADAVPDAASVDRGGDRPGLGQLAQQDAAIAATAVLDALAAGIPDADIATQASAWGPPGYTADGRQTSWATGPRRPSR
jgi:hypothetical protein